MRRIIELGRRLWTEMKSRELIGPTAALGLCSAFMLLCFTAPFPTEQAGAENSAPADSFSSSPVTPASEAMKRLAWMIGYWELTGETTAMKWAVSWGENQNYLIVQEILSFPGRKEQYGGLRIFAWNPIGNFYNTAFYGSDGSFGNGVFENGSSQWILTSRILLANGQAAAKTDIFTPHSETGGFAWKSTSRTVADTPLPNLGPLEAKAVPPFPIDVHVLTTPLPAILEADE